MTDHRPDVCPHCGRSAPPEPRLYSRPPDQLDPRRVAEREAGVRYREVGGEPEGLPVAFGGFR